MNRTLMIVGAILMAAWAFAGDPRTNNPNPEPGPGTNTARHMPPRMQRTPPQQLQSAVQTNAPAAAPVTPPPAPKLIGIVLYDVYAVQASPTTPPLLVVDPRYLHDLTNHYRFQYIPVLRLEEP